MYMYTLIHLYGFNKCSRVYVRAGFCYFFAISQSLFSNKIGHLEKIALFSLNL